MRIKPLKIVFESLDAFVHRAQHALVKAVHTNKTHKGLRNELRFATVAAYQQVMSDQKYAILATIYQRHPGSIYQLAKILGRTTQNVIRDCRILEQHGFIVFEELGDERKTKIPRLAFDYNCILVCMPGASYQVTLDAWAA